MMQHIASPQSEVAALPLDIKVKSTIGKIENREQFESALANAEPARASANPDRKPHQASESRNVATRSPNEREPNTNATPAKPAVKNEHADSAQAGKAKESDSPRAPDRSDEATLRQAKSKEEAKSDDGAVAKRDDLSAEDDEALEKAGVHNREEWLAMLAALKNELEKGDGDEDVITLPDEDGLFASVIDEEGVDPALEISAEDATSLIASLEAMINAGSKDTGREEITPIDPIMTSLLSKLDELAASQNAGEAGNEAGKSAEEELLALATQLLKVQQPQQAQAVDGASKIVTTQPVITDPLQALAEQVATESETDAKASNEAADVTPEDAALLISLLRAQNSEAQKGTQETGDAGKQANDRIKGADGLNAALLGDSALSNDGKLSVQATEAGADSGEKTQDTLLQTLLSLDEPAQEKAADALAERVIAALPSGTDDQTKASVKASVLSGLKEMQAQVAQGHEPGISLKDMIAASLQQADMANNQVMSQVDSQLAQLQHVMLTAQQTSAHASLAQVASTDTMIQENSQVRSEAGKGFAQQQGLDKAVNIHQPEGQQQLTEKVRWMVNSRNTMAEIRLDPPELGSMQVRVNVSGDAASVNFVVQSAQARDALAEAVPRLRDMLAEQGISLGESSVQQQASGNGQDGDGEFAGNGGQHQGEEIDMPEPQAEQVLTRRELGGIDYYA